MSGAAGERCFVTRPLQVAPSLALFVVFSHAVTTLGPPRALVARIASTSAHASTLG